MEFIGSVVGILLVVAVVFFALMTRFAVRPKVSPLEKTKEYLINIPIMKAVFTQTRKGAIEGANEYSASVQGNSIVVSNHPFRGAVIGFIGGCIGGLAVGPIIVAFYALKSVITFVKNILDLVSAKKSA